MIKIIDVEKNSIADRLGLQAGDQVLSINNNPVNDEIDFRFYSAEENLELCVQRNVEVVTFEIEKEFHEDIGIELESMKMKACGNNCVFCFVYQNPRGLRRALYFKDEDFRFSFLYGHYVTLTTVKESELERIVAQRLSPLYISVHATDEKTRKLLLGLKKEDHLMEKISFLVEGGIELHAQIVLCPGFNDGEIFDRTVADLKEFYPGVKSIAVVPVGLTRHREKLFSLRLHRPEELREMILYTDRLRRKLYKDLTNSFVYLSDEFFIKADIALPPAAYYDAFYQIENGVGEFRDMIDQFDRDSDQLPEKISGPTTISWVTGTLAADMLEKHIIRRLNQIENLTINLIPVKNDFYGHDIEVSGLLVGQDIFNHLKDNVLGDLVLLPPRVLNHDNLFLDDWSVKKLHDLLNTEVIVYKNTPAQLPALLEKLKESA
jgi:putative radical SAM enzyme (TIGR03279 family)